MSKWAMDCECGLETIRGFETNPKPGLPLGFQCDHCGRVLIGRMPGVSRFQRPESTIVRMTILDIFAEMKPRLTVRQIYYALTVKGIVEKTEKGYRQTCYHLAKMRREGSLPYGWIADNTRWQIKPTTYSGLDAALARMQEAYRRDLWANQDAHVEIWVEKDALAGVISPVTQEYDVPLMVARGYGSMTFIHDAAEELKSLGKPAFIYHFGDFDPSGVDAAEKVRDGLREHGASIHFERVAITPDQIEGMNLPTRETKKADPRSKKWGDKPSVELDAMPAPVLRDLVRERIERHIDPWSLKRTREIETLERATLAAVIEQTRGNNQNFVPVQNFG